MKSDARTRYTQMVIRNAFYSLIQEKALDQITVTEICSIAEINRSTFYKHYLDVYDLSDKIEGELIEKLVSEIDYADEVSHIKIIHDVLEVISENRTFFSKTSFSSTSNSFTQKLASACFDKLDIREDSLSFSIMSGGISGAISYWLASGMKESVDQMTQILIQYVESLPKAYH